MMDTPDFTQSHIVPILARVPEKTKEFTYMLNPTGYLLGIVINPSKYAELKCHVSTYRIPKIDDSEFYVNFAMTSGGVVFPKPLQNFSTADPYMINIKSTVPDIFIPDLAIYPIGCWPKR